MPKRKANSHNNQRHKRKSYNLLTLRQTKDYKEFGELHPVDDKQVSEKKYTKVREDKKHVEDQGHSLSSSEEEEEDVPVLKQLMMEIGVKETKPESEQEESEEEDLEEVGEGSPDEDEEEEETEDEDEEEETEDEDVGDLELEGDKCADKKGKNKNIKINGENSSDDEAEQQSGAMGSSSDDDGEELTLANQEDEDESSEGEEAEEDLYLKESDPFVKHFEVDRELDHLSENTNLKWKKSAIKVPGLGKSTLSYTDADLLADVESHKDLKKLCVKPRLIGQVGVANIKHCNSESLSETSGLSSQQLKLFTVLNSYQDIMFTKQSTKTLEETRLVYCLHALNHILKARSRVVTHNAEMKAKKAESKKASSEEEVEHRDQGLTRPRVLFLLPYRDRALKVVKMFTSLLSSTKVKVHSEKRFDQEYAEMEDSGLAAKSYKTDDFKKTFEGNTDDNFRVGMTVTKNTLHLYSPFYESDIILASPLGLRAVIGLEGDKKRDFDFLSSIEVLIIDQTDVFLMQNWDHFIHVMKHLHLQPREFHDVDFSRVRMWAINGWSKFYRQTIIFTSVILPEILTVFNKMCHNYAGKVLVHRETEKGTIQSSLYDSPQFFHRVACNSPSQLEQRQAKFEYLKKKILPYHTSAGMKQTLIYCNYYSFVMLRNYFRSVETDFLFINEYDTERHMRNTRIFFRKRHPHFMLYTERLHFHYRFRLRGIHHILWFDLPQYPAFYPELVNLMESRQACTSSLIFTKYDAQKLMEIVGNKQAAHMLNSEKNVNMITVS